MHFRTTIQIIIILQEDNNLRMTYIHCPSKYVLSKVIRRLKTVKTGYATYCNSTDKMNEVQYT